MRKPQPPGRPAGGGFGSGGGGARTTHSQLLTVLSFLACLYVAGRCGGGEEREREREGEGMESMGVGGDDWFFLLGLFSLTLPPLSLIQTQSRTHLRTQQAVLHQPGAVVYGTWIGRDVFFSFSCFFKTKVSRTHLARNAVDLFCVSLSLFTSLAALAFGPATSSVLRRL